MDGTQFITATQKTWLADVSGVYDEDQTTIDVTIYEQSNPDFNDYPPGFCVNGTGLTAAGLREAGQWLINLADEIGE